MPGAVDVKRLAKMKAEQERKLAAVRARVNCLATQERRVWKDVTVSQHMSLQMQEAELRRQAQQAERMRVERETASRAQVLRDRAQDARRRAQEVKDNPRLTK